MGRAGEAALELLAGAGVGGLSAWDSSEGKVLKAKAERWRARGVTVTLGGDGLDALRAAGGSATLVKSPGIDMDTPLMLTAAEQGHDVIDELELGWRAVAGPVFAVTGTNGKSTTCALVASVLQSRTAAHGAKPAAATDCERLQFACRVRKPQEIAFL